MTDSLSDAGLARYPAANFARGEGQEQVTHVGNTIVPADYHTPRTHQGPVDCHGVTHGHMRTESSDRTACMAWYAATPFAEEAQHPTRARAPIKSTRLHMYSIVPAISHSSICRAIHGPLFSLVLIMGSIITWLLTNIGHIQYLRIVSRGGGGLPDTNQPPAILCAALDAHIEINQLQLTVINITMAQALPPLLTTQTIVHTWQLAWAATKGPQTTTCQPQQPCTFPPIYRWCACHCDHF
jgi:hypothetical protein